MSPETIQIRLKPGEELVRFYPDGAVYYVYHANDGELFQSTGRTLEEAREVCAKWILSKNEGAV